MEWKISTSPVPYPEALSLMESRVAAIHAGKAPEMGWLLEHPPLYTSGTSAKPADLLDARFPVYDAGRGGEFTYHGPGQRVAYLMLDLKKLFAPSPPDLHAYVQKLEHWIIETLKEFGVEGFTRHGRIGVWVNAGGGREDKIAALGVRVRKWVSFHGISLNVHPDLSHYEGIVPCGIREHGVTSLHKLGIATDMASVDAALRKHFERVFKR